ncbi:hypothetical protein [Streptomyces sp. enrichment culture]|uniref:hypothetical protein n=1 Tax=Streptomyces sp. enrichment culture TaxID=1795815 RepID=UPI003F560576
MTVHAPSAGAGVRLRAEPAGADGNTLRQTIADAHRPERTRPPAARPSRPRRRIPALMP